MQINLHLAFSFLLLLSAKTALLQLSEYFIHLKQPKWGEKPLYHLLKHLEVLSRLYVTMKIIS